MRLVLHLRPTTYDKQEQILKLDDLTDCTGKFSGFEMALAAETCLSETYRENLDLGENGKKPKSEANK